MFDDESRQAVRPAGRFRIYLGSAAGVGKTCAMLDEGWRRHQRGADVVIGFVETHGRAHTAELIRDLAGGAPQGRRLPGQRRSRRWTWPPCWTAIPRWCWSTSWPTPTCPGRGPTRSAGRTCSTSFEAGIAVVSTVNIQHLESLADAVEAITGVAIRERVPDWVVRQADQIELIDSSADQLRRRMLHGNIYPAEKVPDALAGLLQDREPGGPARAGPALRGRRDRRGAPPVPRRPAPRRGVGHEPSGSWWRSPARRGATAVVRRAARMARRVKGDLLVVHVRQRRQATDTRRRLGRPCRQLVDDVGGHVARSGRRGPGPDGGRRSPRSTRSPRSWWGPAGAAAGRRCSRGSVVRKVLRFAAEAGIDVHVIARRDVPDREPTRRNDDVHG